MSDEENLAIAWSAEDSPFSRMSLMNDERNHLPRFEPLLGVAKAARLLGVHPKTLQAMARAGHVPCVRMGKYWRFRESSLDIWIRKRLESENQSRRVP